MADDIFQYFDADEVISNDGRLSGISVFRAPETLLFGPSSGRKVTFPRGILQSKAEAAAPLLAEGLNDKDVVRLTGIHKRTVRRVRKAIEAEAGRRLRKVAWSREPDPEKDDLIAQLLRVGRTNGFIMNEIGTTCHRRVTRIKRALIAKGDLPFRVDRRGRAWTSPSSARAPDEIIRSLLVEGKSYRFIYKAINAGSCSRIARIKREMIAKGELAA